MIKKCFVLLLCLTLSKTQAADVSSINMVASKTEVAPGENITYILTYANNSDKDLTDVVVSLDMNIANGLTFVNSSLPQFWNGSTPYWRISNLPGGSSSTVSITVNVASDYSGTSLEGAASISAENQGELINESSNVVGVSVAKPEEKKEENKDNEEENKDKVTDEGEKNKEDTTATSEEKKDNDVVGYKADGAKSLKIDNVIGGANLANYSQNINAWDNRFLWVGLVSFSLVLVVGILAFVLGRRVK